MTRPTLIIMLKEPRAGRVKTRLGKDIGLNGCGMVVPSTGETSAAPH